jgi:hypothetical protein
MQHYSMGEGVSVRVTQAPILQYGFRMLWIKNGKEENRQILQSVSHEQGVITRFRIEVLLIP